jgi:GT2 family glycosyltransferase
LRLTNSSTNTSPGAPDSVVDVAVVVPTLNGLRFLPTCLDSLRAQTRQPAEIVVVDDGSSDETVSYLADHYPEARVLVHAETRGVASAFNTGVRSTKGSLVVLLNNDTEVEPTWLAELCAPFDDDPSLGSTASKLLLFDRRDVLHSAGDYFGRDGMPGNRGVWQVDRGQFEASTSIFGPCAAAGAYRRSLFDDIGLFDESLGSYCEDVDLNFRAVLANYSSRFVPTARVYHRLSATGGGKTASYFVGRNAIWVLAQNLPDQLLARYWPLIARRQAAIALEAIAHWREPAARARFRGQVDGLRAVAGRLGRRRVVQARRRISMSALDARLG